jgi:hypothetical protein
LEKSVKFPVHSIVLVGLKTSASSLVSEKIFIKVVFGNVVVDLLRGLNVVDLKRGLDDVVALEILLIPADRRLGMFG